MSASKKIVLVATMVTAAAAYASVPTTPVTPSEHLGIEMNIQPVEGRSGQFVATVIVTDLDRNVVVSKPSLRFAASGATIETGAEGEGQWGLRLGVAADAGSHAATYEALITRDNKVISKQRVAFNLGS